MFYRLYRVFNTVADLFESILLLGLAFILSPYVLIRELVNWKGMSILAVNLLPHGLYSTALRANLHLKFGRLDKAKLYLESLVYDLEDLLALEDSEPFTPNSKVRVCSYFYRLLIQMSLSTGKIDEGMVYLLKANKSLGIDNIQGLEGLNTKTATIVRAGIAAGRLLDEGGIPSPIVIESDSIDDDIFRRRKNRREKINKSMEMRSKHDSDEEELIIDFPTEPQH